MKIIFFDNVIFEGDKEEGKKFKKSLMSLLWNLRGELKDIEPRKETDTNENYFKRLQLLRPYAYESLCYLKELVGDGFVEFVFLGTRRVEVSIRANYTDHGVKKEKVIPCGYIFFTLFGEIKEQTLWIEEDING